MIDVATEVDRLEAGPQTQKELYELLRDQIGTMMLIRHRSIERAGALYRLSYNREYDDVYYSFGGDEMNALNIQQHIEIRLDGIWKTISPRKFSEQGTVSR